MKLLPRFFRALLRVAPSYYVLIALLLTIALMRPQMLNFNVLSIFIRQVAPLGVLVLGQLLVMRVRSIDLSGAGVVLMVNFLISSDVLRGVSPQMCVLIALAIGLGVGLFNGLMVGFRRASAVIVTMSVNMILIGVVQYIASGKPPGDVPAVFGQIYNTRIFSLPVPIAIWVVLSILVGLVLSRSVFGRYIQSVGENPIAAHFSGVPVERTVVIAHTLAGLAAAIAGLIQMASIAVGSIRIGFDLPLLAVAATILGGVIFGRGEGGVLGPFVGVLSFALLFVVMTMLGVQEPGKLIAQGLIIMIAAAFYGLRPIAR